LKWRKNYDKETEKSDRGKDRLKMKENTYDKPLQSIRHAPLGSEPFGRELRVVSSSNHLQFGI
jgi:hypothetical protein